MNKWMMVTVALMLAASSTGFAAGNAARGEAKVKAVCAACHGADGNSASPDFPRLAGQEPDYIVHALTEYKTGKRKNPIMAGMAAPLTLQDMEDVAAYFSRQKGLVTKY